MKYLIAVLCLLGLSEILSAQVVNRYPYIQRPSQTTATIAWRRANASTGTLYLGTAANVWSDSVSTAGTDQKHFFDLAGLQENTEYFYQVRSVLPATPLFLLWKASLLPPCPLPTRSVFWPMATVATITVHSIR